MAIERHFAIDYSKAVSKESAVFKGEKYRITILSEILVRLEYNEQGLFENRPTELAVFRDFEVPEFKIEEDEKFLVITTKYFELQYIKNKPFIGPSYAPEQNLRINLVDTDKRMWYFRHPEARNFNSIVANIDKTKTGLEDSQTDLTKVKKKAKELFGRTKGLYSADGFVSINDSNTMVFLEDGTLKGEPRYGTDTYVFLYKRDFGKCLQDYFRLTGLPPLIPRYALGIWWNRNELYSFEDTKKLLTQFNKHQIPFSVLLLGDNWHMKDMNNLSRYKTGFTFNPDLFPNPSEFIKYMHDRGIRVGLAIDTSEGIYPHEARYDEISKELKLSEKHTIPINVFDNTVLSIYMSKLIAPLYSIGTDFFWLTYLNKDDNKPITALNYYHFNDFKKFPDKRGLILSRISNIAPHRYPVHYSGETSVSWDTLKILPYFNSTSSNLGLSWWSHDIGGYKDGIEDSELYMRYVQLGTYSPIFRFSSKYGKYYKREPWKWDIKTEGIVRDYCRLRHSLIPYLYTEAYNYTSKGVPLVQPLYYKYPEIYDEPTYRNEYYFGSQLVVAPITTKKETIINRSIEQIFMPEGLWYDFKTGKKFPGNKRYVTFYKDEDYPVFAKSGAIIPLADFSDNINVTNNPNSMEIHVFPGLSNTYNLYEDDGYSSLYEEGYYILTKIDYNYMANNYTLIIRPIEGKTGIIPEKRNYRIRFRNTRQADEVIVYVGQTQVKCESYTDDTDFIVSVSGVPTTTQLTINCKGRDIEIDAVRLINEDIDDILNDIQIETVLKEKIAKIIFSELSIEKKRIEIRKMKKEGLDSKFVNTFIRLLEYIASI